MPSFVVGFLILAALEVVTSSDAAAGRAALIPTAVAGAVRRLLDPELALIPNWHDNTGPQNPGAFTKIGDATRGIADTGNALAGAPTPAPTKPRRP